MPRKSRRAFLSAHWEDGAVVVRMSCGQAQRLLGRRAVSHLCLPCGEPRLTAQSMRECHEGGLKLSMIEKGFDAGRRKWAKKVDAAGPAIAHRGALRRVIDTLAKLACAGSVSLEQSLIAAKSNAYPEGADYRERLVQQAKGYSRAMAFAYQQAVDEAAEYRREKKKATYSPRSTSSSSARVGK